MLFWCILCVFFFLSEVARVVGTKAGENPWSPAVSEEPCKNNGMFKSDDIDSGFLCSMHSSELQLKWFVKCLDLNRLQ